MKAVAESGADRALSGRRGNVLAVLVSMVGVTGCLVALAGFLIAIASNKLGWYPGLTVQEFYLEVGRSYSQGFVVGFFLAFFMCVGAIAVSQFVDAWRRRDRPARQSSPSDVTAA